MLGDKKALRLFLSKGVGKKVTSKALNDSVGWDFRKYVSNLRKQGIDISHSHKAEGLPQSQNFYVLNTMPDEDTIITVLNKGHEKSSAFEFMDLFSFRSMFP